MSNFGEKTKIFLKNKCDYIIVGLILFVLFNILCLANSIFPYGTNTMVSGDSFYQIAQFSRHIFDVFEGKSTLMYSNAFVGGVEIFSTIEYMLLNPFYLIILPFGRVNTFNLLSISYFLMIIFDAFVAIWFARKHFKNINTFMRIVLAIMFCFCNYVFFTVWFTTWTIFPALALLLIDAFIGLVRDGKMLKFSLILAWTVINSFSVGLSSNIVFVCLFSLYIMFVVPKEKRKSVLPKFFLSYVVAILISVTVLFPSIYAMLQASRIGYNMSSLFSGSSAYTMSIRICGILFDSLLVVFAVLYLIFCDKKQRENKFFIFAFLLLLLPNIFSGVFKFINLGRSLGFPFRFTYINTAFNMLLTFKFFELKPLERLMAEKNNRLFLAISVALVSLMVAGLVISMIFVGRNLSDVIKTGGPTEQIIMWVMPMFVMAAVVISYLTFVGLRKILTRKTVAVLGSVVMISLSLFNAVLFVIGNDKNKTVNYNYAEEMLALTEEGSLVSSLHDENDFVVSKFENYLNGHNRTASYFSSVIYDNDNKSYLSIGANSTVCSLCVCSNALSESMFGVNYYISSMELDRPYLEYVSSNDNFYLYKNKFSTTGAFVFDDGFEFDENLSSYDNLQKMAESLGVSEKLFENLKIPSTDVEVPESYKGIVKYFKKYSYTAIEDCILYINADLSVIGDEFRSKIGEDIPSFFVKETGSVDMSDLTYLSAGENIDFYIYSCDDIEEEKDFTILNYDALSSVAKKLQERQVEVSYFKDGFKASVPSKMSGELVIFGSVNISGMNYMVDAKSVEPNGAIASFASFKVSGGEVIEGHYKFPMTAIWIVFAVAAVAIIVLIFILSKKFTFEKLYMPINVLFYGVNLIILSIFFGFGVVLSFFR